ncbi:MAG: PCRF domain-containing protein, partial [Mycobacteriaceae bacterium]
MQPDVTQAIDDLDSTLTTIEKVLDLDELDSRSRELESQAAEPSLWDDPDHAQQVTSQLSHVQARLKKVRGLRGRLDDLPVMYEMADESEGAEAEEALELASTELGELREEIDSLEVTTMLSGEYDSREAVVNIRSAAGGVDAADWAEMLMRMYTRWAEKNGHKVEVYDISYAEEAGIKS